MLWFIRVGRLEAKLHTTHMARCNFSFFPLSKINVFTESHVAIIVLVECQRCGGVLQKQVEDPDFEVPDFR